MKETYIEKTNREGHECLQGDNYPEKTGLLLAHSQMLRGSLAHVIEQLERLEPDNYSLTYANLSFNASAFIDPNYISPNTQHPMDRKLSSGLIKDGNTGKVSEPLSTPKSDFPKDLPSNNKGF